MFIVLKIIKWYFLICQIWLLNSQFKFYLFASYFILIDWLQYFYFKHIFLCWFVHCHFKLNFWNRRPKLDCRPLIVWFGLQNCMSPLSNDSTIWCCIPSLGTSTRCRCVPLRCGPPLSSVIAAIGLPLSRCSHKLLYCCAAFIQVFFFEYLEILRMLYPAVPYIRIDYVANYI